MVAIYFILGENPCIQINTLKLFFFDTKAEKISLVFLWNKKQVHIRIHEKNIFNDLCLHRLSKRQKNLTLNCKKIANPYK